MTNNVLFSSKPQPHRKERHPELVFVWFASDSVLEARVNRPSMKESTIARVLASYCQYFRRRDCLDSKSIDSSTSSDVTHYCSKFEQIHFMGEL
jgi:hypothetical protein